MNAFVDKSLPHRNGKSPTEQRPHHLWVSIVVEIQVLGHVYFETPVLIKVGVQDSSVTTAHKGDAEDLDDSMVRKLSSASVEEYSSYRKKDIELLDEFTIWRSAKV